MNQSLNLDCGIESHGYYLCIGHIESADLGFNPQTERPYQSNHCKKNIPAAVIAANISCVKSHLFRNVRDVIVHGESLMIITSVCPLEIVEKFIDFVPAVVVRKLVIDDEMDKDNALIRSNVIDVSTYVSSIRWHYCLIVPMSDDLLITWKTTSRIMSELLVIALRFEIKLTMQASNPVIFLFKGMSLLNVIKVSIEIIGEASNAKIEKVCQYANCDAYRQGKIFRECYSDPYGNDESQHENDSRYQLRLVGFIFSENERVHVACEGMSDIIMDAHPVIDRYKGIWILLERKVPPTLTRIVRVVLTLIEGCHCAGNKGSWGFSNIYYDS